MKRQSHSAKSILGNVKKKSVDPSNELIEIRTIEPQLLLPSINVAGGSSSLVNLERLSHFPRHGRQGNRHRCHNRRRWSGAKCRGCNSQRVPGE